MKTPSFVPQDAPGKVGAMKLIPRPTIYKGIKMRSRLEAKCAQWLDFVEAEWQYEPICYADERGQYLPDFVLPKIAATVGGFHQWRPLVIDAKPTGADVFETLDRMRCVWSSLDSAALAVCWPRRGTWAGKVLWEPGADVGPLYYGRGECGHFTIGDGFDDECGACFLEAKGR